MGATGIRIKNLVLINRPAETVCSGLGTQYRREVAVAHGLRWDTSEIVQTLGRPESLPVGVEPRIVLNYRSSKHHAILILTIGRFRLVEEIPGIQDVVSEELPCSTMKLVGSRPAGNIDIRAR